MEEESGNRFNDFFGILLIVGFLMLFWGAFKNGDIKEVNLSKTLGSYDLLTSPSYGTYNAVVYEGESAPSQPAAAYYYSYGYPMR